MVIIQTIYYVLLVNNFFLTFHFLNAIDSISIIECTEKHVGRQCRK